MKPLDLRPKLAIWAGGGEGGVQQHFKGGGLFTPKNTLELKQQIQTLKKVNLGIKIQSCNLESAFLKLKRTS